MQEIEFKQLLGNLNKGIGELAVHGITGSQKAYLVAQLRRQTNRPFMIITANEAQADQWLTDLAAFLPGEEIYEFPARDYYGSTVIADSHDIERLRMQALVAMWQQHNPIVVTTLEAVSFKVPPADVFAKLCCAIKLGGVVDQRQFISNLVQAGYERVAMVESRTQFSVRGGIVDVYPLLTPHPVRIEFFGDEIDSLRYFELGSQRSLENLKEVVIPPARELVWLQERQPDGLAAIHNDLEAAVKRLEKAGKQKAADALMDRVNEDLEKLQQGLVLANLSQYFAYFNEQIVTPIHYLGTTGLVVWDEPARLKEESASIEDEFCGVLAEDNQIGLALQRQRQLYTPYDDLVTGTEQQKITLSLLPKKTTPHEPQAIYSMLAKQAPAFHGQMDFLLKELKRWLQNQYRIMIVIPAEKTARSLFTYFQEQGLPADWLSEVPAEPRHSLTVVCGELMQGFELSAQRLVVLSEKEVFGERRRPRRRKPRVRSDAERITSYRELNVGDYVVHVHHGIGKYLGIKTLEIDGVHRDYLYIRYKGEDKLYVPVEQIHLVQKYVGSEGKKPKVYSLGGQDWQRVKQQVRASVRQMAKELLELYAKRQTVAGFAFSKDSAWQREFEDAFPYQETDDQLKAIEEVKRDMEKPRPMDRLLCGDVGYGKTEVAIRAAFKACMDGKQVAVLVPTTVLAHQHYNTFGSRFADYPINIAMMSRFRTRKENAETAEKLRKGLIDIVIGTHRLLQKDVQFKDLGLLIIDEEQRFGVRHKERIKQLRANVDVLTLTATPIPRTLHMAMVGIRDLSVIETPPENRYPVQTYVVEYNHRVIKEAIERELDRGGQVYYVHNRVKDIHYVADKVAKLVPQARIAVAHGQMPEQRLERLMLEFLEGEYDVLVTTTIIESGLDIPNVNTIIVEDADRFGLAQLYQLRGRVGRSNRIAYAYLTYRPNKILSQIAEKRLSAIKEFTELGAGFKIALRDLQIRGAGNILGPEQSGFMVQVGFDLYCQLLEQAVRELKGEKVEEPFEPNTDLNVDAYIPDRYISEHKQKIEMYKKLLAVSSREELQDIIDELLDRFGDMPLAVVLLTKVAEIRMYARLLRITDLIERNRKVTAVFDEQSPVHPGALQRIWREYPGKVVFRPEEKVVMEVTPLGDNDKQRLTHLANVLSHLWQHSQELEGEGKSAER